MFEGHRLHRVGKNWFFDLTTFIGYKVELGADGRVMRYSDTFKIVEESGSGLNVLKYEKVPLGIIRKSYRVIEDFRRRAYLS